MKKTTDYSPLTRLHIKQVFPEICQAAKKTGEIFPFKYFECSSKHIFFIRDDSQKGHIVIEINSKKLGRNKMLTVKNKSRRNQFIWRIDGEMFKNGIIQGRGGKCDGALVNRDNLYLIEFKSNAHNKTIESIESNYSHAYEQIVNVLKFLREKFEKNHLNLNGLIELKAIIVSNSSILKPLAFQKRLSAKLLIENKIKLYFVNEIEV